MQDLEKIKNPHDRYFKANMQDARVARDFFEAHLPASLLKLIDFNTLKLESGSFISKELKELLSDLIYSVKIGDQESYLYFVTEHQSTLPELMPFRNLQYNCSLMDQHLKQIPKGEPKLLPLIINIVFYHGEVTPYVESCALYDYFSNPALAREWMLKPFTLIDINQIPDGELAQHKLAALFELMQKHSRARDMLPFLEKLLKGELKLEVHQYGDLLYLMVKYVIETGEVSDEEKFVNLLMQALPQGEKKVTTLAQTWLNQGYEKGIHAGIEQGEHAAKKAVAKRLLKLNIDLAIVKSVTGLSGQDLLKLVKNH